MGREGGGGEEQDEVQQHEVQDTGPWPTHKDVLGEGVGGSRGGGRGGKDGSGGGWGLVGRGEGTRQTLAA